jgi:hypothetical protein
MKYVPKYVPLIFQLIICETNEMRRNRIKTRTNDSDDNLLTRPKWSHCATDT